MLIKEINESGRDGEWEADNVVTIELPEHPNDVAGMRAFMS